MAEARQHRPVLRVMAISSCHEMAFDWAIQQAEAGWGPICLRSPRFDFSDTKYYTRTMGDGLLKQLVAFETLIDQSKIVDSKLDSNAWEKQFKEANDFPQQRPINLDPVSYTHLTLPTICSV